MVKLLLTHRGINLVELLIVTSVLGIIAMMAYPKMMLGMEESRLSSGASDITTALGYAQLKALNSGLPTQVEISANTDSVTVEQFQLPHYIADNVPSLDEAQVENGTFEVMAHPFSPGTLYNVILAGDGLFGGIDVTASGFGAGDTVIFDALGTPSDGGTVTLVYGGNRRIITLDALTGKVTVSH